MRTLLAAFFFLLFSSIGAFAGGPYFVAPTGNDGADCLSVATPCLTLQHVVDIAPNAQASGITLADGAYASVSVQYYKIIGFFGNCADPSLVSIGGTTAVTGQDHAVVTISCLTLASSSVGLYARQFAIADANNIRYGPMVIGVSASETSKINVCGATLLGNITYPFAAGYGSTVFLGCSVAIPGPITVGAFAYAVIQSILNAGGATFTGLGNVTGLAYINDNSTIIRPPGGFLGSVAGSIVQNGGVME